MKFLRLAGLALVLAPIAGLAHAAESAPAAVRPKITGIAHLVVLDQDLAAARHFYTDVIGWPASAPLAGEPGVHFQVGLKQYIEVRSAPSHQPPDRVALIAFETADVRALLTYLAANGVAVPAAVETHANGSLSITVADPDGYPIEFVQGGTFPASSPRALSSHLIHIGFDVRNLAAQTHFFMDLLGFKPYWHGWRKDEGHVAGQDDYRSIQVPNGTDWIEFMITDGRIYRPDNPAHNPHHFAPGVVSVAAVYAQVQQRDAQLAAKFHTNHGRDGKMQLNLFDPDHTRVEFMNFLPNTAPDCSPFTGPHPHPEP